MCGETQIIGDVQYALCGSCNKPIRGTGRTVGGRAVFVSKDFIRRGRRVPFTDDWIRLCEAAGFVLERRVRASLVKEQLGGHLFEEEHVKTTARKSFFRRLAEAKGSPPIDEEDVTFFRRLA